jgi:predicted lipoprotein with Yx(FWY)xxD motif
VGHHTRAFIAVAGAVFVAGAATAYTDGNSHSSAISAHAPQSVAATSSSTISAKSGPLGKILVNSKGQTLYLFQADKTKKSTCTGSCAHAWPPATVSRQPTAANGVKKNLLSTTTRSNGSKQVTYNGHPLYTFSGDKKAGQTHGQGLNAFGAKWYVMGTNGKQITKTASSAGGY